MEYFKRISDVHLRERLEALGAVLIEGPKWCGKTTTAEQQAKSIIRFQDPDERERYDGIAANRPSLFLKGDTPRLIDEWQDYPVVWDAIRLEVDQRQTPGQFILTGSNVVDQTQIRHSGTGRISRMEMLPMSLWESHESNGEVSIRELFNNPKMEIETVSQLSIDDLIYAICRGGWPAAVIARNQTQALSVARDYVQSVCTSDISRVDKVQRNPKLARQILRSYARNISTLAKASSILQDVIASENIECSRPTFDDYVSALEKLFVIQDIDAWCPAIRSKTAIRSGVKRAFCDPSIAVALLGLTQESMQTEFKTLGFIFEQLCIRDLKAYTSGLYSDVAYYNDRYGLEADIVLHLDDGQYALVECKLGSREIEDGAAHLLELQRLIREHNLVEKQMPIREPDLLIVLTGGQYGYRRKDGVYIIPIGNLKD
jgi:predicted AAA+ superfamily ATPase